MEVNVILEIIGLGLMLLSISLGISVIYFSQKETYFKYKCQMNTQDVESLKKYKKYLKLDIILSLLGIFSAISGIIIICVLD